MNQNHLAMSTLLERVSARIAALASAICPILTVGLILFAAATTALAQAPPTSHRGKAEQVQRRADQFQQSHKDSTGSVRLDLLKKGIEDFRKLKIAAGVPVKGAGKKAAPFIAASVGMPEAGGGVTGVQWTQIGPQPLRIDADQIYQGAGPDSGEVTDIAIDPRNSTDQVIYIATSSGGIWKTTDGGASWKPKSDYQSSLSMGALALDPGNPSIVYAGTGNQFSGFGIFSLATGILKSIDGGETWTNLNPGGIFTNVGINRMVMPAAGVLLVGSAGGVFRSGDGGLNFGNNSPLFNNGSPIIGGFVSDLDLDTASPSTTVYASVTGSGIFRSTDAGVTFPTNLFSNPGAPGAGTYQFIALAQSVNPDNLRMYASVQRAPFNMYRSDDGGANWAVQAGATAAGAGCQCGYDQTIGVDPQDQNRVYLGFQELHLSTDGSNFGGAITTNLIHWDHHALTFSPSTHWGGGGAPTRIWVGTDGGISSSINGGVAWSNLNETIASNLITHMDIGRGSPANNAYSVGGTQDTGTLQRQPGYAGNDWHLSRDGDGSGVAVDPTNPLRMYSTDNGNFQYSDDAGTSWSAFGAGDLPGGWRYAIDPNDRKRVFAVIGNGGSGGGGTSLWRNTNTVASPLAGWSSIASFTAISSIANTGTDSNLLWLGLYNGSLRKSTDATAGSPAFGSAVNPAGAPGTAVTGIAINPLNTDEVVAVYRGFCGGGCSANNRKKHVFRTANGGTSWTDISGTDGNPSGNLPDLPLHSVVLDSSTSPPMIIVSSDAGVARSVDNGATWQVLGVGLPNVDSKQLALDDKANPSVLRIGTHGRSAFELTEATGPLLAVNADLGFGTLCTGGGTSRIVQLFNVGSTVLHISSFFRASGSTDFTLLPSPPTPTTINPGEELDFTIQFNSTSLGNQTVVFQINSDDPFRPAYTLFASGSGQTQAIAYFMANSGNFGEVCLGDFKDLSLTIGNNGCGTLSVTNLTSSSGQFVLPGSLTFPLNIAAGVSIQVPVRFQPTTLGAKAGNLTISSNAPGSPSVIAVSGIAPPPDIRVTGDTAFGDVCAGALVTKTIDVHNVGRCTLHVTSVAFDPACPDFTIVTNPFPAPVSPDSGVNVTLRFTPTTAGPKSCTLKVSSDDPDTPVVSALVTANTPLPIIDVPLPFSFLPEVIQSVGACTTLKPFPVSNNGSCNLTINSLTITGANATDYSMSGQPSLPTSIQPGHILGEGGMKVVFAPTALDRDRLGTLNVTYVSEPVTLATTVASRDVCGEGVKTGARVLVTVGGAPAPLVEKIQIQRITGNRNRPQLNTVDVSQNLTPTSVIPTAPCPTFMYHKEYSTVANDMQLLPGSYQVTATVVVAGKRTTKTVGFDVTTCDFNPSIVITF